MSSRRRTVWVALPALVATLLPLQGLATAASAGRQNMKQVSTAAAGPRAISRTAVRFRAGSGTPRQAALRLARTMARQQTRVSADVMEFGRIGAVHGRTVSVRWISMRTAIKNASRVYKNSLLTPTRTAGARVAIPTGALLQLPDANGRLRAGRATSLRGLRPGMDILLAGTFKRGHLVVSALSSLTGGQVHSLASSGVRPRVTSGIRRLGPRVSQNGEFKGCGPVVGSTCDPKTNQLAFDKRFDFTNNGSSNGVDIFDLGVFTVYIQSIDVGFDLGQTNFDWPFTFSATPPDPFYQTENQAVGIQVTPQTLSGQDQFTFYNGFGFNIGFDFYLTYVGGSTDPGPFYLPLMGSFSQTNSAAPMQGQSLAVKTTECPGISVGIPDVPALSVMTFSFCFDYKLTGSNFQSDVSVPSGGALTDLYGNSQSSMSYQFDGTNPQTAYITPNAGVTTLRFGNFYWAPTLDFGGHFRLSGPTGLGGIVKYDFPGWTFSSGAWPMIGTADQLAQIQLAPDNQPVTEDLNMDTTPEPTYISYSGPATGDYHDAFTISGNLVDRLSRGISGMTVFYSFNNESVTQCGSTTTDSGAFSCSYTPTGSDGAGNYPIKLSFVGATNTNGTYASSTFSPTFTVTSEDSSLTIGGDTSGAYGGSVGLNGTLTEDNVVEAGESLPGPAVAGRTVNFNWGSQSCSPQPTTDSSGYAACSLTLAQPAGSYTAGDAFNGDSFYQPSGNSRSVSISRQAATITLNAANVNPVKVDAPGGTASPAITATVTDTLPAGNIGNAVTSFTLTPIGPGTTYNCTVTPTGATVSNGYVPTGYTISSTTGTGCPVSLTQAFNSGHTSVTDTIVLPAVQTNVYTLSVSVGGDYYTGGPVTSVETMYDPSLGFVSGGGTVINPITGFPASFGYVAKYVSNLQLQGSVNFVEHRPTGNVTLKSGAIKSLTVVNTGGPPSVAYIQGTASVQNAPGYRFLVAVFRGAGPRSSTDQFGLRVLGPSGLPVSDLTFPASGPTTGSPFLTGGTINFLRL